MTRITEKLLRCLWAEKAWKRKDLSDTSGMPVKVISPGWWNLEAGPDFHQAIVRIGKVLRGDVEVHRKSSDWIKHGHNRDANYNRTILQVVFEQDMPRDARTAAGRLIHVLILGKYYPADSPVFKLLQKKINQFPAASWSGLNCPVRALRNVSGNREEWLAGLGEKRLEAKARWFGQQVEECSKDQLLYRSLLMALGFKKDKKQFSRISVLAPYASTRAYFSPSLFLGLAGWLEKKYENNPYFEKLVKEWKNLPETLRGRTMVSDDWRISGARPANFPVRRLAAAGILFAGMPEQLFATFYRIWSRARDPEKAWLKIKKMFTLPQDKYWSWHYTLSGKKLDTACCLIGEMRVRSIMIDVLLPLFLANAWEKKDAEQEKKIRRFYRTFPKSASNYITRLMCQRLFGKPEKDVDILKTACSQQALIHLFKEYCKKCGAEKPCLSLENLPHDIAG